MMPAADSLGIEPMCRLAQVSRAGYYRFLQPRYPGEEDMEVRNAIQQIVVEHRRRYGYRRVTVELGRRGMRVNHKRVLRLMREDNLLGIQPAAFVATTDSNHDQQVYLNLARRTKLTGINQLWVADITYIRLRQEFVYLAVVLDAFSRSIARSPRGCRCWLWNAPLPSADPHQVWCTTPTAARSMPPSSTSVCLKSTASCPA
jgi:putative transposase